MKLSFATFVSGDVAFTLFEQDIERLERLCNAPSFLAVEECRRFAEDMVKRAVYVDTGEPLVDECQACYNVVKGGDDE